MKLLLSRTTEQTPRVRDTRVVWFCILALALVGSACRNDATTGSTRKQVIVLGFDGMDYELTRTLMAAGRMPNFQRLADTGRFATLGTAVPPQSPVAWSNFITGMDSGGHGIFDFIHRNPQTMIPYLSTSRAEASHRTLALGSYRIPLAQGEVHLLRHGKAFWEVLEEHGIETTVVRMPANFPPSGTATREISGMGTPDLLGTYGTFFFYTSDVSGKSREALEAGTSGGRIQDLVPENGVARGVLQGPGNPFLAESPPVQTPFRVYVDPTEPLAKLAIGPEELVLQEGEWSDWVPIAFDLIPTQKIRGMCRFYLKQVRPHLELYVTPINLDPLHPEMPISTPASYSKELARSTGRYYTQGMPEDTKALSAGVLDRDEFLAQAHFAGRENIEQYESVLAGFETGLLFYYFGNLDQISHMMWRPMDPEHPAYDPGSDSAYAHVVPDLYRELDAIVGYTLDHMDPTTTLIVMSDHGFASWRRAFHLNGWLREQGYLDVRNTDAKHDLGFLTNVAWSKTRAYGLGLNGLYINRRDRERWGTVSIGESEELVAELGRKLLALVDPTTGEKVVTKVYRPQEVYQDRGYLDVGPDLIVGYAKGTRCSHASAAGEIPTEVFADNTDEWSGDHCMDHETVPGILLTNRVLQKPAPSLRDLGGAILAEFEIE